MNFTIDYFSFVAGAVCVVLLQIIFDYAGLKIKKFRKKKGEK